MKISQLNKMSRRMVDAHSKNGKSESQYKPILDMDEVDLTLLANLVEGRAPCLGVFKRLGRYGDKTLVVQQVNPYKK